MRALLLPVLAVLAGVVSFSSPCCLPLIPGYLSYVSALPVSELGRREARAVTFRASLLFVAGFTLVFSLLGVSLALVGSALLQRLPLIVRVSGVGIIVMGLAMMGLLRIPLLTRERRFDLARVPTGPRGAFFLGSAFEFGWTPCIGPILATILTAAAATGTAAWGAVLLVFYSLGLGLPFIALGLGFQRARGSLAWLRRHARGIEVAGGAMLVAVGVLFVTGAWRSFFIPLQRTFAKLGWPPI
ncbi:MAG: cytochrome c biogenesis protein CcdA [Acidimicrobiales bacterium]